MKLRAIPEPILGPFPRKKPELTTVVSVPKPVKETAKETKPEEAKAQKQEPVRQPPAPESKKSEPSTPAEPAKKAEPETKKQDRSIESEEEIFSATKLAQPFKPIDPMVAMMSENPTLLLVMLRQLRDMKGPMPDTTSGALKVMEELHSKMKNGEDITELADRISIHVTGLQERNELLSMLHESLDWERAMEIFKSRAKFEDFAHGCMRRSDVNVREGMALTAYMNEQLVSILARIKANKKAISGEGAREAADLLSRVNLPTQREHQQIQTKFDAASPSEREILRKLGVKLELMLAARVTTASGATETVEVIQQTDATEG